MLLSLVIHVKNLQQGFSMMKQKVNLYADAHLFISAIRIIEHRKSTPPSVEAVCDLLDLSIEQGRYLCRKLFEIGVIDTVAGAYQDCLVILDHTKLESIPKQDQSDELQQELEKFQRSQKDQVQKVEAIKAAQAEKKKTLFAEMEKKLKKELDKH
jgi:hypothetical protein